MRLSPARTGKALAIGLVAVLTLSACGATRKGQPGATIDPSRPSLNAMVINSTLSQANIGAAISTPTDGRRNAIILARIAEIDMLYNEYETDVLQEARSSGFLVSFGGALAGLAGASATSVAASQNWSLLSGGLSAADAAYDKEFLAEQTMNALVAQMRAERARVLGEIYDKMRAPVSRYPMQAALSDLENYRQAGTMATGLVAMNTASIQRAEFETEAAAKKVDRFVTGVERRPAGAQIQSDVITRSFQDRVRILSDRVRNGQVSGSTLADFMNDPPLSDPEYKQQFTDFANVIKSTTGQQTVRAQDLNSGFLGAISGFIANTTTQAAFIEAETALAN
jgi:hypothetical protein